MIKYVKYIVYPIIGCILAPTIVLGTFDGIMKLEGVAVPFSVAAALFLLFIYIVPGVILVLGIKSLFQRKWHWALLSAGYIASWLISVSKFAGM